MRWSGDALLNLKISKSIRGHIYYLYLSYGAAETTCTPKEGGLKTWDPERLRGRSLQAQLPGSVVDGLWLGVGED